MTLPWIAVDKANHHVYGNVIFAVGFLLTLLLGGYALLGGLAWTLLFAAAKEEYSAVTGKGVSDLKDAYATMSGALPAALTIQLTGMWVSGGLW